MIGLAANPKLTTEPGWPKMAAEAYYGLAGRIVETIAPHSEADPVGILAHLLVATGNVVGRGPHALVEQTVHTCGEYFAMVGATAKGRKGQAWSTPRWLMTQIDAAWARERIRHGLSSGEGLIFHIRDPHEEQQPVRERGRVTDYQTVVVDPGEPDKRLLVVEPELATVLRRMAREGSSLSAVLREAWETGDLATLTRHSPLRATGAHVSIIAHTTRDELVTSLTATDAANGYANRWLYILVRRAQYLPEPSGVPEAALAPLAADLRRVVEYWTRRGPCRVVRDADARALWAEIYPDLSAGESGLVGALLARAEAHVLRLSLLYAVLDCSDVIRPEHLRAALAWWDYAEASARQIFGGRLGLSVADKILDALRRQHTLTRTEIRDVLGRNSSAEEIDAALALLAERGVATRSEHPPLGGVGRPIEIWTLA